MRHLEILRPDEVIAEFRRLLRARLGDTAENGAKVYARNGWYYVEVEGYTRGHFRRSELPALLKLLAGKRVDALKDRIRRLEEKSKR